MIEFLSMQLTVRRTAVITKPSMSKWLGRWQDDGTLEPILMWDVASPLNYFTLENKT